MVILICVLYRLPMFVVVCVSLSFQRPQDAQTQHALGNFQLLLLARWTIAACSTLISHFDFVADGIMKLAVIAIINCLYKVGTNVLEFLVRDLHKVHSATEFLATLIADTLIAGDLLWIVVAKILETLDRVLCRTSPSCLVLDRT